MTQFIAKTALITGMAVTMAGCAQMGFIGDNLLGSGTSTANFVTKSSDSLLRPAPSQHYIFESAPTPYQNISSPHHVKTAFARDGGFVNSKRVVVPRLNQLPVPQTQNYRNIARLSSNDYHANQHQPSRYQTPSLQPTYEPSYRTTHKARRVGLIPRRIVRQTKAQSEAQLQSSTYAQPKFENQNQVQNNQDISFVKIGGGSDMNDWKSCQQKTGSYYQKTETSYRVDPNFESCMRGKGYKPESEAKAELNL